LLASPAPAQAPAPISFLPPGNIALVGSPGDLDTADLDGDGHLDLAVHERDGVSILYGHGDGTFDTAVYHEVGNGLGQVLPVDVNGDGRLDLVVSWTNGNRVAVLLNQGSRVYSGAATYSVGAKPFG